MSVDGSLLHLLDPLLHLLHCFVLFLSHIVSVVGFKLYSNAVQQSAAVQLVLLGGELCGVESTVVQGPDVAAVLYEDLQGLVVAICGSHVQWGLTSDVASVGISTTNIQNVTMTGERCLDVVFYFALDGFIEWE